MSRTYPFIKLFFGEVVLQLVLVEQRNSNMAAKIRVLVADDERPARLFLIATLRAFPGIEIVAEAANGADAIKLIATSRLDVIFLDIQMPDINGVELINLLQQGRPLVVFVTAHEEYIDRAKKLNAVDYLLKPVSVPRLGRTLELVRRRLDQAAAGTQ
jgi:two-component system, LytTR family, response regulator